MDVHRAIQDRIGSLCIHGVEHAVDGFVAACSQDCSAQKLVRLCVNNDLHQTVCFALFDGTCDASHGPFSNQNRASSSPRLSFRQTGTAEWRVDVQRVCGD